jgi:hypothetical protein
MFSLAWSMMLVAFMATGTFSTARIGNLTWGPSHDIWSAAAAISQIRFGLSGNVSYKEVEQAIADVTTSGKNALASNDEATLLMDQDPVAVTRAFQSAAMLTPGSIAIPKDMGGYVTDWCEDLGYADFYNVAFRLFGFTAFSTHWLYFCILSASFLLFSFTFRTDDFVIALLNLTVTALFLASATSLFSVTMPSFAANRYLTTLAIIPLLHILCTALLRRAYRLSDSAAFLAQCLIMWFAINARSSGNWCIIALVLMAIFVALLRRSESRTIAVIRMAVSTRLLDRSEAGKCRSISVTAGSLMEGATQLSLRFLAIPYARNLCGVALIALAVTGGLTLSRHALYSARYSWEDNLPHHLIWHSAYLGLQLNPAWAAVRPYPYPDVPLAGDGAGFMLFVHWAHDHGVPFVSQTGEVYGNAYIRAKVYEKVIRQVIFDFALKHPVYMLQLYLYYKPLALAKLIGEFVGSIGWQAWLFALVPVGFASTLFASREERYLKRTEIVTATTVLVFCSQLPNFWAYPASHVVGDALWSALFTLLIGLGCAGACLGRGVAYIAPIGFRVNSTTDRPAH